MQLLFGVFENGKPTGNNGATNKPLFLRSLSSRPSGLRRRGEQVNMAAQGGQVVLLWRPFEVF
jgi:hypothetical protein